jgi:hypothetical protein
MLTGAPSPGAAWNEGRRLRGRRIVSSRDVVPGNTRDEVDAYRATVDWLGAILGWAPILGAWNEPSGIARDTGWDRAAHAVHGVVFRPFFERGQRDHVNPFGAS